MKDKTGKLTPMFVQFVLKNIWDVYNAVSEKYTCPSDRFACLTLH